MEKLAELTGYEISPGQLSRVENGNQPYTQDLLEAAAVVLQCGPEDIIMRDPTAVGAPWTLLEGLNPQQVKQLQRFVQVIREDDERTGTSG
ncbi:helix-turn-helix domain-containing protein [Phenylobacterium sp. J426]|nr:helix-turn-helix domain-containing protein [Phenylobacterium sp. J426]